MFTTRQKQREMTGKTENKYFTEPPYYTHDQQNKQALIVAADAVLTQTLTLMPPLDFSEELLSILIHTQSSRFNCSSETRLTYINELVKIKKKKSKKPTLLSMPVPVILSICIIH